MMISKTKHPIEGSWLPVKAELAGDAAPAMALGKLCLVINAGTYAVYFGNEMSDSGSYALGVQTEHQSIVLSSLNGTNKGLTIPSIYQLVGDRLRICFGLDGIAPPDFSSPVGSRFYLVAYRRKI